MWSLYDGFLPLTEKEKQEFRSSRSSGSCGRAIAKLSRLIAESFDEGRIVLALKVSGPWLFLFSKTVTSSFRIIARIVQHAKTRTREKMILNGPWKVRFVNFTFE